MLIGDAIRYLRKKHNLTQSRLADGICDIDYIGKLENNRSFPTTYILKQLSDKLGEDIYKFFLEIEKFNDFTAYLKTQELTVLIESEDLEKLEKFVLENENTKEFENGESLQILCYAKAICFYSLHDDNDKAIETCLSGLKVYKKNFKLNDFQKDTFSNIELNLINCIAATYCISQKSEQGILLYGDLYRYLENHIINSAYRIAKIGFFHIDLYNAVAYNYSNELVSLKKYESALEIVDKSIQMSLNTTYMGIYPFMLRNKFEILYMLGDYENAQKYYNKAVVYYEDLLTGKYLQELIESVKNNFPCLKTGNSI